MKPFKFFQKPVKGDLSMLGGEIFHTMSYDDNFIITGGVGSPTIGHDTPEDHYAMRRLYHINPAEYERQRQIREDLRAAYRTNALTQEEILRFRHQAWERMRDLNDNIIQPTPAPNPNWYQSLMKLTNWFNEMYGVVIFVAMILSFFILLFNVI